ncbi:MAG TPA: ankyrin repeat domain-containing protein [Pyrinomonadaceae bacterium]|nr:ankyrin repeat domain-containing protein [Pyrinomonadaceae bacterium]
MPTKNFLKNLTIPAPCSADWNSMIGNDQVRFCDHCSLDVHNISLMTRSQAERLIARANGRLCVRYHQNPTGTPATLPYSQKLHRISRRVSRIAAGAFTATLSVSSAVAQTSTSFQPTLRNASAASQLNGRWVLSPSIGGTVTDQNGAVISGATVSVSNKQFNIALYVSTGTDGQFKIDSLPAGVYQVRIEAPGFAADEIAAVYVRENDDAKIDRTLRVASIEATVEVESGETVEQQVSGGISFVAPEDPFVRAAQEDNLEALTALIAGRDVNVRDKQSNTTALEHAVRNANREMVQLLLSAGADVNAKNESGETVLMLLDADATTDLVWDLINAGAAVNARDNENYTPLMRVASANNLEALKTLIDAGSEVNTKNEAGQTALMLAASEGFVNIVRALVLAGADINATDDEDESALDMAVKNNHLPVARFLKFKGAFEKVATVTKDE